MANNNPNQNNNNQASYPYDPYQSYYYAQYYGTPAIPQGDPSAALSSMVYQLQQQTQQRQALGASVSSALGGHRPTPDYYTSYYAAPEQRSVIQYDDLSLGPIVEKQPEQQQPQTEDPNAPSEKKPKFCCGRWLKSAIAVAQHEKLHIQCPSCEHMCLKSVLTEHEEDFHGKPRKESDKKPSRPDGIIPPNAPRIETPEELEAWIAARKKNWPSKNNVERKKIEEDEKEARGEISNKKRAANKKRDQQNAKRQKLEEKKNSLVAQYDSDSDSDDPEAMSSKDPKSMGKILLPEDKPKRKCKYFALGRCSKGDECDFSHEKPPRPKQPKAAPTFKKRPNLLFKLLEKEIMQEKNVILQCLRYIVDNDYFRKEKPTTSEEKMADDKQIEEIKADDRQIEGIKADESLSDQQQALIVEPRTPVVEQTPVAEQTLVVEQTTAVDQTDNV